VLNTCYQLSTQPTGCWGGLSNNLTIYGPDTAPVKDIDPYLPINMSATTHSFFDWWPTFQEAAPSIKPPFIGATTMSKSTSSEEVFVCQFAWLALLFTISCIIFATGLFALVLKRMTLGPEVCTVRLFLSRTELAVRQLANVTCIRFHMYRIGRFANNRLLGSCLVLSRV
jgi:hypothetical protein